jgi:uncharacterized protein (TIGR02996 family)
MAFGDNLRRCREAKGISESDAARVAGVTVRRYDGWERGRTEPPLTALRKLAAALGVSADVLLEGVGDPPPPPKRYGRPEEHESFLAAIRESPGDETPLLVYADWLEDQGDLARAEFIRQSCRARRQPADGSGVLERWYWPAEVGRLDWSRVSPELAARVEARRRTDEVGCHDWMGLEGAWETICGASSSYCLELDHLPGYSPQEVAEFVRRLASSGQVRKLTSFRLKARLAADTEDLTEIVAALAHGDGWGELRELGISLCESSGPSPGLTAAHLEALSGAPHLRRLTELSVQVAPGPGNVATLARAFPALEALSLQGLTADGGLELAAAELPALRHLEVDFRTRGRGRSADIGAAVAGVLTTPRFPRLASFRIVSVQGIGGFTRLLRRGPFRGPTLRCVRLINIGMGADDAAALAGCPALREVLDLTLSSNRIGDAGAAAVAAEDWPRLVILDLGHGGIGAAGANALAGAKRMPELQRAEFGGNDFGPDGCRAFTPEHFPRLRYLSLFNCGADRATQRLLGKRFGSVVRVY